MPADPAIPLQKNVPQGHRDVLKDTASCLFTVTYYNNHYSLSRIETERDQRERTQTSKARDLRREN